MMKQSQETAPLEAGHRRELRIKRGCDEPAEGWLRSKSEAWSQSHQGRLGTVSLGAE
jgi:hypothetical protein